LISHAIPEIIIPGNEASFARIIPAVAISAGRARVWSACSAIHYPIAVIIQTIAPILISPTITTIAVLVYTIAAIVTSTSIDCRIVIIAILTAGSARRWITDYSYGRIAIVIVVIVAAFINQSICVIVYIVADFWRDRTSEISPIAVLIDAIAADFYRARPDACIVIIAIVSTSICCGCRGACGDENTYCFSNAAIAIIIIIIITAVIHNTIPVIINIIAIDFWCGGHRSNTRSSTTLLTARTLINTVFIEGGGNTS